MNGGGQRPFPSSEVLLMRAAERIYYLPFHHAGEGMREHILSEIRRLAAESGKTPGVRLFGRATGIRQAAWRGVYWVRWGDAVREAGLEPNEKQGSLGEEYFMTKLADACRHFGQLPTAMEMRMYKKQDADFPNVKSLTRHFGSLNNIPERLAEWAKDRPEFADLVAMGTGNRLSVLVR